MQTIITTVLILSGYVRFGQAAFNLQDYIHKLSCIDAEELEETPPEFISFPNDFAKKLRLNPLRTMNLL